MLNLTSQPINCTYYQAIQLSMHYSPTTFDAWFYKLQCIQQATAPTATYRRLKQVTAHSSIYRTFNTRYELLIHVHICSRVLSSRCVLGCQIWIPKICIFWLPVQSSSWPCICDHPAVNAYIIIQLSMHMWSSSCPCICDHPVVHAYVIIRLYKHSFYIFQ